MLKNLTESSLFKNTLIYTILQIVNKGIPFFLLPILTRYLSTSDYGIIATYNTFMGFLAIFIGLNMHGAVNVAFFQLQKEQLKYYVGNVFNLLIVNTLIMLLIITLLLGPINKLLNLPIVWIYIAVVVALMQNMTSINLVLWRAQKKAKAYTFYEISQTVFNVCISLILIVIFQYAWEGRLQATAACSIGFGLLSMLFIYRRCYLAANISKKYIKDILRFGIPLLPHSIALWMRVGVDILLITTMVSVAQAGVYSIGYQLGAVVGLIAQAFNNAYSPFLFEKLKDIQKREKKKIVLFTYLYFVGIICFAIGLSSIFKLILPYLLGERFQASEQYIFWVAVAYAFNGMYLMVVNYIFYAKKTHLLSMVTIFTSIFHVIISYVLILYFGAIGAAYASVISFSVSFLIVWRVSASVFEMPWKLRHYDFNLIQH